MKLYFIDIIKNVFWLILLLIHLSLSLNNNIEYNDIINKNQVQKQELIKKLINLIKSKKDKTNKQIYNNKNLIQQSFSNLKNENTLSNYYSFLSILPSIVETNEVQRKTQDGRLCSKSFYHNGVKYNDCTKTTLPTGMPTSREWCYVADDQSLMGSKWDFCTEIMDYDKIRQINYKLKRELVKETKELQNSLSLNVAPAKNTLDSMQKIKQNQTNLLNNLNTLKEDLKLLDLEINKVLNTKVSIDELNQNLLDLENKYNTESNILSNSKNNYNCFGMLKYEDNIEGDGLIGYYFNNEYWLGLFKEKQDDNIKFDWTNIEPIENINKDNFSVIWEGYILPPHTGKYKFVINADTSSILYIKNKVIITHNVGSFSSKRNKLIYESTKDSSVKRIDPYLSKSRDIVLIGDRKVPIKLAYYHSVHSSFYNSKSFVNLSWESDEFDLKIIEKKYLYSTNNLVPLKVTYFNSEYMLFSRINNNETFFKNSKNYIIQDLPNEFNNLSCLKFNTNIQEDVINFKLNTKSIVYVGFLSHYPNFLNDDFENTGYKFQLLELDNFTTDSKFKIKAKKSSTVLIFKKEFSQGQATIEINKYGINKEGVNLILFFGINSSIKKPISCSGELLNVSLSNSKYFKSCSCSSYKPGYNCEYGFSERGIDEVAGMWVSDKEGVGAWIQVDFNNMFEISKFVYKNRLNPSERSSKLKIEFSNGDIKYLDLKNSDKLVEITFEPIIAISIKITIIGVYGPINNGGFFAFYGIECFENSNDKTKNNLIKEIDHLKSIRFLFDKESNDNDYDIQDTNSSYIYNLECKDSISNTNKFDSIDLTIDKQIIVFCPEECDISDYPIYGYNVYTKDSSICKAAYHSKYITSNGGHVTLIIKSSQGFYNSQFSNGIYSMGKTSSSISIKFESYVEEDSIVLKTGSKIDYKYDNLNDISKDSNRLTMWEPAIIMSISETNNGKFIKIYIEGSNILKILN